MTFLQLAAEIETRILDKQPYKTGFRESDSSYWIEFYECDDRSITYKIDAHHWEKMKELMQVKKI